MAFTQPRAQTYIDLANALLDGNLRGGARALRDLADREAKSQHARVAAKLRELAALAESRAAGGAPQAPGGERLWPKPSQAETTKAYAGGPGPDAHFHAAATPTHELAPTVVPRAPRYTWDIPLSTAKPDRERETCSAVGCDEPRAGCCGADPLCREHMDQARYAAQKVGQY